MKGIIDSDLFHGIIYPLGSLNQKFSHFVAGTSLSVFVFVALLHSSLFMQKLMLVSVDLMLFVSTDL